MSGSGSCRDQYDSVLDDQPTGTAEIDYSVSGPRPPATYERIRQLEQLNATLAAEVDRMRPVVEAAQVLARSLRRHLPESWSGTEEALERVVTTYESSKPK